MNPEGKIHLNHEFADPSKFEGSPHVLQAIEDKTLSVCGANVASRTVTDITLVTCIACLKAQERLEGEEDTHS